MKAKKDLTSHIGWRFLWWMVGLVIIILIWTILALTAFKHNHKLPDPIMALSTVFQELGKGHSWGAIWIAIAQALAAFLGSFLIASGLIIWSRYHHIVKYVIQPFIVLGRSLPTLALQILIATFCPLWLVSIVIPFMIVFPMTIESLTNAVDNVDVKLLEMANVFNVSRMDQIKKVYLPSITPYAFSTLIAGFGLTFKVVLASQVLNNGVPGYDSIGFIMVNANNNGHFDIIIAWAIIAITISLCFELILKSMGRICMPWRYNDQKYLHNFFTKGKFHD
ncbi:MAG: ABC transporter permease subunit [Mycoplasmataceae bacterium]|nr:ABC transporter permease subunit [Mycoplasmataceae bacterium]